MRSPVKVVLADDHTLFREGLAKILSSSKDVEVVGKTDTGQEAVSLVRKQRPDVLLMEIDESLERAKSTLRQILTESPALKVIILSMFEEPRVVREVIGLGANAYVHKSASVEELLAVMRTTVLTSGTEQAIVAMPRAALYPSEDAEERKDREGSVLTHRELEIILLAARGMSNRQIANDLVIAEVTVKRHLANTYPKMGVSSRGEALRKALQNEWFTIRQITKV